MCPSCSTDLSLFSADDSGAMLGDPEELKKTLLSSGNGHLSDLLHAAEDHPLPPQTSPAQVVYDESVECPACNKPIPADAAKCPHCGVEFEVEEVFECPMCRTLIDINVNKCPSCNAEFETEAAPPETQPAPQPIEPVRAEPPPPEPKKAPLSFAERLKQVKDEPSAPKPSAPPEPRKEMTFAERMKAMKDEKSMGEAKPPAAPEPAPVSVSSPAPKEPAAVPTSPPPKADMSLSERVMSLKQGTPGVPGVTKAEPAPAPVDAVKEGFKELPKYIGEVKKLLVLANELRIDASTSKVLINKAVAAGKTRDLENAIKFVKEGKAGLERDIRSSILSKLRTIETALSIEKKSGRDVSATEHSISEIRKSMEMTDFQTASDTLKKVEEEMMKSSTTNISQVELESVSCALVDAEYLHLNVSEARSLFDIAAQAKDDPLKSSQHSKQATEVLNRILPSYIASEMRKAKITLREIKMMNVDISNPVNLLKEANDHVLNGDYCAALGAVRKFREFVDRAQGQ